MSIVSSALCISLFCASCAHGQREAQEGSFSLTAGRRPLRAVARLIMGAYPALEDVLGLRLVQVEIVYPAGTQLAVRWLVVTNQDVLDTGRSTQHIYASRNALATNTVWLGLLSNKIFSIPGEPITLVEASPADVTPAFGYEGGDIFKNGTGVIEIGSPVNLLQYTRGFVGQFNVDPADIPAKYKLRLGIQAQLYPLSDSAKVWLNMVPWVDQSSKITNSDWFPPLEPPQVAPP